MGIVFRPKTQRSLRCPSTLLNDVGQFVRQQISSGSAAGRVLPRSKDHFPSDGVRQGIHSPCGFRCVCIRMHANMTEVVAEARLHESACGGIKRFPWRAQYLMDDRRYFRWLSLTRRASLESLLAAFATFAAGNSVLTAAALTLQEIASHRRERRLGVV
jgi:hypothetical protein